MQIGGGGNIEPPSKILGEGCGPHGFAETGEVLAQALALYMGPDAAQHKSPEDPVLFALGRTGRHGRNTVVRSVAADL